MNQRKSKLDSIATLLEKALVVDPYRAPNSQQCIPSVFINQKLYGKATKDDPVNNTDFRKRRSSIQPKKSNLSSRRFEKTDLKSRSIVNGDQFVGVKKQVFGSHNDSITELSQKTAFKTGNKNSNYEKKVDSYLENWYGTTQGLPLEWVKNLDSKKVQRQKCEQCERYRCSHQIYHGRVAGLLGRQI